MDALRAVSPCALADDEQPWILWEQRLSVTDLLQAEKTDERSANIEKDIETSGEWSDRNAKKQTMERNFGIQIRRSQYDAVMGRMQQACHQAGRFSAWQT